MVVCCVAHGRMGRHNDGMIGEWGGFDHMVLCVDA